MSNGNLDGRRNVSDSGRGNLGPAWAANYLVHSIQVPTADLDTESLCTKQ